jgi:2-keto-4-pentenoate hydratase
MNDNAPIAKTIADEIAEKEPFAAHAEAIGSALDGAYAIQEAVKDALIESGARPALAGFKIAMNTRPQMDHFGIEEPAAAFVFTDQRQTSPAARPLSAYRTFAYEPEICAIMGATLAPRVGLYEREEVAAAIERFVPSFELLDTRGAKTMELPIAAVVAQNVHNDGIVIGGPGLAPDALDADALHTVVRENGTVQLDVTGGRPQNPLDAATFIVNHMTARGHTVEAGMVILCGAHQPPRVLDKPTRLELDMGPLGTAVFDLAAS